AGTPPCPVGRAGSAGRGGLSRAEPDGGARPALSAAAGDRRGGETAGEGAAPAAAWRAERAGAFGPLGPGAGLAAAPGAGGADGPGPDGGPRHDQPVPLGGGRCPGGRRLRGRPPAAAATGRADRVPEGP